MKRPPRRRFSKGEAGRGFLTKNPPGRRVQRHNQGIIMLYARVAVPLLSVFIFHRVSPRGLGLEKSK